MKLLDCFCGMGGVSDGFALEGFDVTGIDIVDAPKMLGYKHRFIQADMLTLKGEDYRGYDVVWGSPPCRDFSYLTFIFGKKWKQPPNPAKGMNLVNCYLNFVKKAKPKFWIMENVSRLSEYTYLFPPRQISKVAPTMRRAFWGNFPTFLMPMTNKPILRHIGSKQYSNDPKEFHSHDPLQSWKRARIPLACSRAFAKACREQLEVKV